MPAGSPMSRPDSGFTLIEVLVSIGAFVLVFLAGFAGIGRLMVTQNANFSRTVGASAAMIMARWHAERPSANGLVGNLTDPAFNGGTTNLLTEVTVNVRRAMNQWGVAGNDVIVFRGTDFIGTTTPSTADFGGMASPPANPYEGYSEDPAKSKDRFFVFNSGGISDQANGGELLDLSNPSGNAFVPSEYDCLLVAISAPSSREADSKASFRQVTMWCGPPLPTQNLRHGWSPITFVMVGRYLLADTIIP